MSRFKAFRLCYSWSALFSEAAYNRVYIRPIPIYGVWDGYILATQFGWHSYWGSIGMMPLCNTPISWNVKPVDDYGGHYTNSSGTSPPVKHANFRFSSMANGCPAAIHDADSDT